MGTTGIPPWVVLLGAIVSGLAVIVGAAIQARRDDHRWQRERDRERERWDREDRFRWSEKKHDCYSNFIAAFEEWRGWRLYGWNRPDDEEDTATLLWKQFDKAYSDLVLLASGKVFSAASAVRIAFLDADMYFKLCVTIPEADVPAAERLARIRDLLSTASPGVFGRYRGDWDPKDAVREEVAGAITECVLQMQKDLDASELYRNIRSDIQAAYAEPTSKKSFMSRWRRSPKSDRSTELDLDKVTELIEAVRAAKRELRTVAELPRREVNNSRDHPSG
jgi:hypothetical protein